MLNLTQLTTSQPSAKAVDDKGVITSSDSRDNQDENTFLELMAQVMVAADEGQDTSEKQIVAGKDIKDDSKEKGDEILPEFAVDEKNAAIAWINSADFKAPTVLDETAKNTGSELAVDLTAQSKQQANLQQQNSKLINQKSDSIQSLTDQNLLEQKIPVMENLNFKQALPAMPGDTKDVYASDEQIMASIIGIEEDKSLDLKNVKTKADISTSDLLGALTVKSPTQSKDTQVNYNETGRLDLVNTQQSQTQATASTAHNQMKSLDLPVDVSSPNWGENFNQQVMWMGQQKINSALIKLHPQELGPLEISIKMDKQSADINISSHSLQVRDLLEQAVPRLRDMMTDQGLNLVNVNIESSNKHAHQQKAQHGQDDFANQQLGATEQTPQDTSTMPRIHAKGLVDYFA